MTAFVRQPFGSDVARIAGLAAAADCDCDVAGRHTCRRAPAVVAKVAPDMEVGKAEVLDALGAAAAAMAAKQPAAEARLRVAKAKKAAAAQVSFASCLFKP